MITLLRRGIDAMEICFDGKTDSTMLDELKSRKKKAQIEEEPQSVRLGSLMFMVQPNGRGGWAIILVHEDMTVQLGTTERVPKMLVKFSSFGLASRGADSLVKVARKIGRELGLRPSGVTRLDLAVDFQGYVPNVEDMQHLVCKSSYRPIYPNVNAPETFYVGKSDRMMRMYNKTKQIRVKKLAWWEGVWKLTPGYDEELPVWRVEFQLRSRALREIGARSLHGALSNLDDIFAHCLDWCSLRSPAGMDSNVRRWPEHDLWLALRKGFPVDAPVKRVRAMSRLMDYDECKKRYLSILATVCAHFVCDIELAAKILYLHALMATEIGDEDFLRLVESKKRRRT